MKHRASSKSVGKTHNRDMVGHKKISGWKKTSKWDAMYKIQSPEWIGMRESNSVPVRWNIYQRSAGEYKNEQVIIY